MRLTALRGRASFSFDPVVVTLHCSAASGATVARTVKYNFNARPKQSKPGPRFDVDAGTRTSRIMVLTIRFVGAALRGRPTLRISRLGRPQSAAPTITPGSS